MLKYSIMIIEDDAQLNKTIRDFLSEKYSDIYCFRDPGIAISEIEELNPDVIILDIFLGYSNGLDILEKIRGKGFIKPVIMLTSFADVKLAVRAIRFGAEDFIVKPLDREQLEITVERALENYNLSRKVDLLSEQLKEENSGDIIGQSEGIKKAIEMGKVFAATDDTTVLLLGETGTGKELLARYIHDNSQRARAPFVTINCGAIPKELAENELFGYERGAFTGAVEKIKTGRFEQAHRGTILLDEIAELTPELQVKLLRVLEDRKFYRLGGTKEVNVDVRVIASTNRDLVKMIDDGSFREDLFYRLNVAAITLPPLRERGNDILLIAASFIDKFNKKFGKHINGFSPEAAEILKNYSWRGNIRELKNVIERVVLLETDNLISEKSLSFLKNTSKPLINSVNESVKNSAGKTATKFSLTLPESGAKLNDVTKDLIFQTLFIAGNDKKKAAKLLGVTVSRLDFTAEQLKINI